MSWTDNELSEMARKAQADQSFTYQDSFWEEMEAMLPVKKKSSWPFFLIATIPILAVVGFFSNAPKMKIETNLVAKTTSFDRHVSLNKSARNTFSNTSTNSTENKIVNSNLTGNISNSVDPQSNKVDNGHSQILNSAKIFTSSVKSVSEISDTRNPHQKEEISFNNLEVRALKQAIFSGVGLVELNKSDEMLRSLDRSSENTENEFNHEVDRLAIAKIPPQHENEFGKLLNLPQYSKRRFFSVYGELGFAIGQAYTKNQAGHVQSINLGAGARLTKKNLFVQTGLGFEIEKAGLELNETSKKYGYSLDIFENRMSYKEIYRANLPVNIGYIIAKHTLQFGGTASYLMSTKMKYAYLENKSMKRDEMVYGEKKGWNSFGLKLNIGYGFAILPSTTFGANFQVQLINQLDKNWSKDANKQPVSGQIFIRKTIR